MTMRTTSIVALGLGGLALAAWLLVASAADRDASPASSPDPAATAATPPAEDPDCDTPGATPAEQAPVAQFIEPPCEAEGK
jgi:hypothetical protein